MEQKYLLIKYFRVYSPHHVDEGEEIVCFGTSLEILSKMKKIISNFMKIVEEKHIDCTIPTLSKCKLLLFNGEILELYNEDRYSLIKWENVLGNNEEIRIKSFDDTLKGNYIIMKCRDVEDPRYIQCDDLISAKLISNKLSEMNEYRWILFDCLNNITIEHFIQIL